MVAGRLRAVHDLPRRDLLRTLIVFDPRGYRHRHGALVVADRIYAWGRWTPFVRVRARRARASEGGTEA